MEWVRAVIATTLGVGPDQDLPPLIMQQETHSIWEQICAPHPCAVCTCPTAPPVTSPVPRHAHTWLITTGGRAWRQISASSQGSLQLQVNLGNIQLLEELHKLHVGVPELHLC